MYFSVRKLRFILLAMVWCLATISAAGEQWRPLGPHGGDVRALVLDPHNPDRVYLGTSAGQLYSSEDGGQSWQRLARVGGLNHVLDNIAIDPSRPGRMYIAAWNVEEDGGEMFRSTDGGRTWKALGDMKGKSVRALELAPSNPNILVAGALDGVFRSSDGGDRWERISPENHPEIKNIESVAVDPQDPNIIYAGTWHLPWKTVDGGKTWFSIKTGIIDDSDVFSIIIDPVTPAVVYASACSGIYKSENAGATFRKVQGIPFSARRTRVLQQDPRNRNIVYAGTTEGLWKTMDGGVTWKRVSAANLIVNDVAVDPRDPDKVMLATDRAGVLVSRNAGLNLQASNRGFSHRQVATLLADRSQPSTLYAGVINDKEFGGVFVSRDAGATWDQMNSGLAGHDVFTLAQAEDGTLVAGTQRGIFLYSTKGTGVKNRWVPSHKVVRETTVRVPSRKKAVAVKKVVAAPDLDARVNRVYLAGDTWFAATNAGLYRSTDRGRTWTGGPVMNEREMVAVHSAPGMLLAASRKNLFLSVDDGQTWFAGRLPQRVTGIHDIVVDDRQQIWVGTREGAFRSDSAGEKFEFARGLSVNQVISIVNDRASGTLLVTSLSSNHLFQSRDGGRSWRKIESPWPLRTVLANGSRVLAATAFDGIVAQGEGGAALSAQRQSGGGEQ